jgi:hypothetical protein
MFNIPFATLRFAAANLAGMVAVFHILAQEEV